MPKNKAFRFRLQKGALNATCKTDTSHASEQSTNAKNTNPCFRVENIYYVTPGGGKMLPQRSSLNSSKEEFAKHPPFKQRQGCKRNFLEKEHRKLLEKFGFSHLENEAPRWWFSCKRDLEKTLVLLKRKRAKGYKTKDEKRWISTVIKDQGRGFRYRQAKRTTLAVAKGILNPKNKWVKDASTAKLDLLLSLSLLAKRGLKLSFKWMQIFLRKGFSQAQIALKACEKALENGGIRDLKMFLNWLVGLKEPFDIFDKAKKIKEKETTAQFHGRKNILWIFEQIKKNQAGRRHLLRKTSFSARRSWAAKRYARKSKVWLFPLRQGKNCRALGVQPKMGKSLDRRNQKRCFRCL